MEFGELVATKQELEAEGWIRYMTHIDAEIARKFACENCGSENMYGEGMKKPNSRPLEYRCFAVCPDCGEVFEF
jgi:transcription elongation factor Elf1